MPSRPLFPADWLVPGEEHEHLGILKTGKESEVHLVARRGGGRVALLAEKRFLARERRLFRDDATYRGVWGTGTRRESRAMRKQTRFGHEAAHARWIANEWSNLVHLHAAGITVPPPVELLDDGYRMAFIGDDRVAAPRLSSIALDPATARRVWDELLDEVAAMIAAERVHGDLSAYNVLWWRDRPVLIDFSQTVDVITHPAARDLLVRDIHALGSYFVRHGVRYDPEWVLARLGADDHRFAAQIARRPPALS
ncbi:MAG TPA: RIO1 family regulatory kinase/ATPase [Candidatus Limnocylindria bacterium]|nr:RIO1 family regulatory kinase/ATPase [Candidatus Limnocylindria bacterium]